MLSLKVFSSLLVVFSRAIFSLFSSSSTWLKEYMVKMRLWDPLQVGDGWDWEAEEEFLTLEPKTGLVRMMTHNQKLICNRFSASQKRQSENRHSFPFFHFALKRPQNFQGPGPITYSDSFAIEYFLCLWMRINAHRSWFELQILSKHDLSADNWPWPSSLLSRLRRDWSYSQGRCLLWLSSDPANN